MLETLFEILLSSFIIAYRTGIFFSFFFLAHPSIANCSIMLSEFVWIYLNPFRPSFFLIFFFFFVVSFLSLFHSSGRFHHSPPSLFPYKRIIKFLLFFFFPFFFFLSWTFIECNIIFRRGWIYITQLTLMIFHRFLAASRTTNNG